MTSGGPDFGSILKDIAVYGPHGPMVSGLTNLLEEAFGLFGEGSPEAGGPTSSDVSAMEAAIAHGMAATAEQSASQDLTDSKQTLQTIDSELDRLAKLIVDDNDACKKKLLALKAEVDGELEYMDKTSDSSVAQVATVQKFLSDKAGEASEVILAAGQQIAKRQQQIGDVSNQYPGGGAGGAAGGGGATDLSGAAFDAGVGSVPYDPGPYINGGVDDGNYGDGGFDDFGGSSLADLGGMLPQMASGLPGALGGLGGGGMGNPMGDLSGLIGSAVRDATAGHDKPGDQAKADEPKADEAAKKDEAGATGAAEGKSGDEQKAGGEAEQSPPETKAEGGGPPPPPPTPAPTMVTRPDGTTATASSAAAAAAARAHLGGADLVSAYKDAKIDLSQPGTPVKDTIPPSQTQMGDLAAFQDRYVMCEGEGKVYLDGQSQPMSALGKLPGFLGFLRPNAPADPGVAPVPAAASAAAASTVGTH